MDPSSHPISQGLHGGRPAAAPAPQRKGALSNLGSDDEFVSLLSAYRVSGGLARAWEVISMLEACGGPSVAQLARWIVERRVISVEWQGQTWLPWFQFKRLDRLPEPVLRAVLAEWAGVCDDAASAHWFARANALLAGRTPIDVLGDDPDAVLQAARADRFDIEG